MARVLDKFWIFTCPAGTDNNGIDLVGGTRMTPAESAYYFGIPNLLFIGVNGIPVPYMPEAYQYAESFVPCKNVGWSIVEGAGLVFSRNVDFVRELAEKYSNFKIAFLDDFFHHKTGKAAIEKEELVKIKEKLTLEDRKLELWPVIYPSRLGFPIQEYFECFDALTFWICSELEPAALNATFERFEKIAVNKRILLGLYFYDYRIRQPIPLDNFKMQCETALEWLKTGRIDGIIFLGNTVADVCPDTSRWLRAWIEKVKDVDVPEK